MSSTDPWKMGTSTWKDDSPLGRSAEEFILENPQYVLYARKDPRFPCPIHYDPTAKDVAVRDPSCTRCRGFGVKVTFQLLPGRLSYGAKALGQTEGDLRLAAGLNNRGFIQASFPRGVSPARDDFVIRCEWDTKAQELGGPKRARVLRIEDVYVIRDLSTFFEREVSWHGCGLEIMDLANNLLTRLIPYLSDIEFLPASLFWSQAKYW